MTLVNLREAIFDAIIIVRLSINTQYKTLWNLKGTGRQCLAAKLVPKLVTDRPTEERPATQHDDSSASVSDVLSNMTNGQNEETNKGW
ncbi:hypothetical protein NQ318_009411 [Aromia moschata]|uniref:Uncharacterized protein n=1 Tax=Aromia moschata TaxID=1265417 RepID=A0AAV8Z7Q8_9CUCU|nr:hypothetical protein NQ318_009411 [Aromia moschata]